MAPLFDLTKQTIAELIIKKSITSVSKNDSKQHKYALETRPLAGEGNLKNIAF